jgi:hypothetical protein
VQSSLSSRIFPLSTFSSVSFAFSLLISLPSSCSPSSYDSTASSTDVTISTFVFLIRSSVVLTVHCPSNGAIPRSDSLVPRMASLPVLTVPCPSNGAAPSNSIECGDKGDTKSPLT